MKKISIILTALIICTSATTTKDYTGFKDATAASQRDLETKYDGLLKASDIDNFIKTLSARPHHLGSAYDKSNTEFILQKFRSWGYETRIDTFYALFPTPKFRLLEEISPMPFKASLAEPAMKEDGTSSQTSEQLPTYNCYSADGDVTGELVYVNQGAPADYEDLDRVGVDVKGKIVIARYGGSWRGIKPRLAQEHGAIGCIIYSDPKDDGYYQGDVYPKGAFRNENGVQRGSVLDIPLYPGDPLTPGYADVEGAKRIERKDAPNLLKIPVLPISYHDAKPFLIAIGGPVAPDRWKGALPLTYHIGPGPVTAHLKLEFNWDIKPVYDVIAVLKGSQYPDEWVIRGNHYDAWVNGAGDPISGQAAMLEEAQAIGELAKQGMHPKRTIVYCAWDGEEEGLLGSTEWVEANGAELQKKAVAYINTDGSERGFLGAGGSHSLQKLVSEVAADVQDPEMNISVLERAKAKQVIDAKSSERKELLASSTLKIEALGSGSDFSPFLQHVGIASLNIGFGGEGSGGEYHSIYDSYDMYKKFKDPGFQYEVVLAKTTGRLSLRLANADVLPFNFHDFYTTLEEYSKSMMKDMDEMRSSTEVNNQIIKDKYYQFTSDPTLTYHAPLAKETVPYIDFSALQNAMAALKSSAAQFETLSTNATQLPESTLPELNTLLYQSERKLLTEAGLPQRGWYKHAVYAPGYYQGYGVKTIPGTREALENRNWKLAQEQSDAFAKVVLAYASQVDAASELLKGK